MNSSPNYLILGAGQQGVAVAIDVALFGEPAKIILADGMPGAAARAATRISRTLSPKIRRKTALEAVNLNVQDQKQLTTLFKKAQTVLSALPYYLNPQMAMAAIRAKIHYCDLGGYFDSTKKILLLDKEARKAGVTLIPDCGVSPGMCNSLALCGMEKLDITQTVKIYCGGLPQRPQPPLNYRIVFNLEGVLGNYFGSSYILKNGRIVLAQSLTQRETVNLGAPLGRLEAAITGGATSTCPWSHKGRVQNYIYKTLRYPGHYEKIDLLKSLGVLETEPVKVQGQMVSPRKLFVEVAGPKLKLGTGRDLLALVVEVTGKKNKKNITIRYQVLDYFDPKTKLTAMQRTTGFSSAIFLEALAQGKIIPKGVVPVEKAMPGSIFLREIRRRGIEVKESVRSPKL